MHAVTDAVHREYDRLSRNYDVRWRKYVDRTLCAALEHLPCTGHDRVLDIACGTGELEHLLHCRWPDLSLAGVDVSLGMLQRASQKPGNEGVGWIQADAASLPFPSESFDHVICANSFHYFPAPLEALREAYRVVRPGGSLVLVDWCDDYLSCKLCKIWLRLTDPAFCRTYSFTQCKSLLEDSGFALVRGDRFRAGWIWGMMRFVCRRPA